MCCVIGLQSTGEANTNQTRDEEGDSMDDFVSAPKRILQLFLTKHFPTDNCDMDTHGLDLLQHQVTCMLPAACHHGLICLFPLNVSSVHLMPILIMVTASLLPPATDTSASHCRCQLLNLRRCTGCVGKKHGFTARHV